MQIAAGASEAEVELMLGMPEAQSVLRVSQMIAHLHALTVLLSNIASHPTVLRLPPAML